MSYEVQREQAHYMLNSARRDEVKIRPTLLLEILDELDKSRLQSEIFRQNLVLANDWIAENS